MATAKASFYVPDGRSAIGCAAYYGADDSVRLLAYMGVGLHDSMGPFWTRFRDSNTHVRNTQVWLRLIACGGDDFSEWGYQARVRVLREAGIGDPRGQQEHQGAGD